MRNPRLASVYAKSLIDLSQQQNSLDTSFADMEYILQVIKASKEFEQVLNSPIIKEDKKLSILAAIIQPNVSATSWAFLTLIVKKHREIYLQQIAEAFVQQYYVIKGIYEVELTTAIAIDESVKAEIVNKVKAETKFAEIKLTSKVDADIIGGFLLEFNNNLVDASVAHNLREIKKEFQDNSYVATI